MDQKTRELRRRNKHQANRRGELPEFEPKGLGRKNKPADTFPLKRCAHIDGGTVAYARVLRANPEPGQSPYRNIRFVKGGVRCPKSVVAGELCIEHISPPFPASIHLDTRSPRSGNSGAPLEPASNS